jgi:hypothetical protein
MAGGLHRAPQGRIEPSKASARNQMIRPEKNSFGELREMALRGRVGCATRSPRRPAFACGFGGASFTPFATIDRSRLAQP